MSLPISQYLDISTGHLPEQEMMLLNDATDSEHEPTSLPTRVVPHAYGAWVWVQFDDAHEQDAAFDDDGRLPNLLRMVRFARSHQCHWINFDRDAVVVDELPSWEW